MEPNKLSIAAKARVSKLPTNYMSNLAKLRHAKLTSEERTAFAVKMNDAKNNIKLRKMQLTNDI